MMAHTHAHGALCVDGLLTSDALTAPPIIRLRTSKFGFLLKDRKGKLQTTVQPPFEWRNHYEQGEDARSAQALPSSIPLRFIFVLLLP
jgi:hypothetical protein